LDNTGSIGGLSDESVIESVAILLAKLPPAVKVQALPLKVVTGIKLGSPV